MTNGSLVLTNLQLFGPETNNALVFIPKVSIRGASADVQRRTARVASVETSGGEVLARRFRDGTLDVVQLAAPPTNRGPSLLNLPSTNTAAPPPLTSAPAWSVVIEEVALKNYAVRVNDEQPPTPANLAVDDLELNIKGLSLASNTPVTVQFSTRVNSNGQVRVAARGTLQPLALETDVDVNGLELRPFQPYVEQQGVKLAFTSGDVSTKAHANVAWPGARPPSLQLSGDIVLNNFVVVDQIAFQDFTRWKQLAVRGLEFVLAPMSVKIREVACDELVTQRLIDAWLDWTERTDSLYGNYADNDYEWGADPAGEDTDR